MNRMAQRRALLCIVPGGRRVGGPSAGDARVVGASASLHADRGIDVTTALLMEYYQLLPERRDGENAKAWAARLEEGLKKFKANVGGRYAEGTLQRLADHPDPQTRRAALLALHLLGTMASNEAIAERLRDENRQVRQMAADALWAIWFRADGEANNKELQKALQQSDPKKGVAALTALIRKAPGFAEAYNQRGILYFQMQEYDKCAADCREGAATQHTPFRCRGGPGTLLPAPAAAGAGAEGVPHRVSRSTPISKGYRTPSATSKVSLATMRSKRQAHGLQPVGRRGLPIQFALGHVPNAAAIHQLDSHLPPRPLHDRLEPDPLRGRFQRRVMDRVSVEQDVQFQRSPGAADH